jgi:transposase-like protein
MPRRKEPRIPVAVLDQLLAGADPKTVFDPNRLLDDLKKALAERVLNAALEEVYPLIFFDALRVKIRDEGLVRNKAVHIALGVRADGTKEILGSGSSKMRVPNFGCAS